MRLKQIFKRRTRDTPYSALKKRFRLVSKYDGLNKRASRFSKNFETR